MARKSVKELFDHPLVFSLTIFLLVVGWTAVFSWIFMSTGAVGPLSVLKGGFTPPTNTTASPA
jgi:hypothetical protein